MRPTPTSDFTWTTSCCTRRFTRFRLTDGGSVSILNGDSTDSLSLMPLAFPARYGDRTGSALDVHTRDGSRTKPSIRAAASVAQVNVLAEGPIGKSKRGSWLASARKSYMQYIASRLTDDPSQAFGYVDGQVRATYDLTRGHSVTLQASDAKTHYDRSSTRDKAGINTLVFGDYHVTLARAGWRYVPSAKILISASGAYMRERTDNLNKESAPLGEAYYGEWIGNTNATWNWSAHTPLEVGYSTRRLRTDGYSLQYVNTSNQFPRPRHISRYSFAAGWLRTAILERTEKPFAAGGRNPLGSS